MEEVEVEAIKYRRDEQRLGRHLWGLQRRIDGDGQLSESGKTFLDGDETRQSVNQAQKEKNGGTKRLIVSGALAPCHDKRPKAISSK